MNGQVRRKLFQSYEWSVVTATLGCGQEAAFPSSSSSFSFVFYYLRYPSALYYCTMDPDHMPGPAELVAPRILHRALHRTLYRFNRSGNATLAIRDGLSPEVPLFRRCWIERTPGTVTSERERGRKCFSNYLRRGTLHIPIGCPYPPFRVSRPIRRTSSPRSSRCQVVTVTRTDLRPAWSMSRCKAVTVTVHFFRPSPPKFRQRKPKCLQPSCAKSSSISNVCIAFLVLG